MILNYTTTIEVSKTLGEIVGKLASTGARSITTDYDPATRQPTAIEFAIATKAGDAFYRLPINSEAIWKTMVRDYNAGKKIPRRLVTKEQAARVGWRIIKDWLEAQIALIETEMVSFDEVMLPYAIADQAGRTVYQLWGERLLALPEGSGIRQATERE